MEAATREDAPGPKNWLYVADLVQTEFMECQLVEYKTWQTVVLFPKGTDNFRGIGVVEVIWKMVTVILNRYIWLSITFHDVLHGFCSGRGTETASLESNILQQLLAIREEVL